jgi:hypothetical protein
MPAEIGQGLKAAKRVRIEWDTHDKRFPSMPGDTQIRTERRPLA